MLDDSCDGERVSGGATVPSEGAIRLSRDVVRIHALDERRPLLRANHRWIHRVVEVRGHGSFELPNRSAERVQYGTARVGLTYHVNDISRGSTRVNREDLLARIGAAVEDLPEHCALALPLADFVRREVKTYFPNESYLGQKLAETIHFMTMRTDQFRM